MTLALMACQHNMNKPTDNDVTVADAQAFLDRVEETYLKEWEYAARVAWIQANFITDDSVWLNAKSTEKMIGLAVKFANEAKKFDLIDLLEKEIEMIKSALERAKGKRKVAAQELGISERTLYRKIKQFDLNLDDEN